MSSFPSLETRHLKRSGLGTPDHYPQKHDQREDLMSENYVREGFQYARPVTEEYASLRDSNSFPTPNEVWSFFGVALNKKREINTCPEMSRKKQLSISKDNYMVSIDRNRETIENWLKNLAGSAPLSKLAKHVPHIRDKDEVFTALFKNDVPVTRAIWFIKMTAVHATVMAESNKKKLRATNDPSIEWVHVLTRLLRKILCSIYEGEAANTIDSFEELHKRWDYLFHIMIAMYDENLLDHGEVLLSFVEMLQKLTDFDNEDKHGDLDSTLKFILPYVVEMGPRFTESEIITRRLLFWVCNSFAEIIHDDPQVQPYVDSPAAFQSLIDNYFELNSCPMHRTIVLCLSALIMGLTLQCPAAVVWNDIPEEDSDLSGSPLDVLPCSLATLPSPPGPESLNLRSSLKFIEENIRERGILAENRWYRKPNNTVDENMKNLLRVLETMDLHDYNTVNKEINDMDMLFAEVFGLERNNVSKDAQLVMFLCEWSVSPTRAGTHRPFVVAALLEMLQSSCDSAGELFQDTLIKFLDTKAPQLDSNISVDSEPFRNLVSLFGELIDRNIFSHDSYVRTLIARGVFETNALPLIFPSLNTQQLSVKSDISEDCDNPDSVRSEYSGLAMGLSNAVIDYKIHSRHIHYLLHFPLPQDEAYTHEQNQRAQLLFGTGRQRDNARHFQKRLVRDVCKLFTKKTYLIDVVSGEMGKRKKKDPARDESLVMDSIYEDILKRFRVLTYYDMEYVVSQCITVFYEALSVNPIQGKATSGGDRNHMYIPLRSTISFFFELMEMSLNITSLLQTLIHGLAKIKDLFNSFQKNRTNCMVIYQSALYLHVVGFLRKYQAVLMISGDLHLPAFTELIRTVRHVGDPSQCSSTDRCILSYLHDLYEASPVVKQSFFTVYDKASKKVKSALFQEFKTERSKGILNDAFATELIENITKGSCYNYARVIEEVQTNFDSRYSFVCNVLLFVTQCRNFERVSAVCIFSAEVTAMCSSLPSEWLSALYTILSNQSLQTGYMHLIERISPSDTSIYEGVAILCGTLLARQCFNMSDFMQNVILPAMAQGFEIKASIEPTIRLGSHIMHRLFTAESGGLNGRPAPFKYSEPLLLTGALQKIRTELLVDILKMLIVHGDKANESAQKKDHLENLYEKMACGVEEKVEPIDYKTMKLGDFTQRILREICCVSWVRERFWKETHDRLIRHNVFIDEQCSHTQARNLLNIIYRPNEPPPRDHNTNVAISRLLGKLDLWTFNFNYTEHQLYLAQIPKDQQSEVLETVAKAIVDMFQMQAESRVSASTEPGIPEVHLPDDDFSWLVPPLIVPTPRMTPKDSPENPRDSSEKSQPSLVLQAQIIKAASEKLESCKDFWSHKNDQEKERDLQRSSVVLAHPPFVTMLLGCLKKEERKDDLLKSLNAQVLYFVQNAKETEDKVPDDLRIRQILQECLQVRLGLVGNLFPRIQENGELCSDWCVLLAQLISFGVVELQSNRELFHTVLDMLSTLVHTLIARSGIDGKAYQNVAKKIRREIADKMSEGVDLIKPLLPIMKATYDVIAVAPIKNRSQGSSSRGADASRNRKSGYIIQKKERMNPWEVIEGVKNLFSLSWFGGVRTERPLSRVEVQANMLLSHDHPSKMRKLDSYYLDPPQLPVEELKPEPSQTEESSSSVTTPSVADKKEAPEQPKPETTKSAGTTTKRKRNRTRASQANTRNTNSPAVLGSLRPPVAGPFPGRGGLPPHAGQEYYSIQGQGMPQHQAPSNPGWMPPNQGGPYAMPSSAPRDVINVLRSRLPYPQQQNAPPPQPVGMPGGHHIRREINKRILSQTSARMQYEIGHPQNTQMVGPSSAIYGGQQPHHTPMPPPNPPPYPSGATGVPQPMDEGHGGPYAGGLQHAPQTYNPLQRQFSSGTPGAGPQERTGFPGQSGDPNLSYGIGQGAGSASYMMQRQQGHHQQQHHPGATPQYHYQY